MRCALPRLGYWERKKGLMKVARTERPAGIKSVHSLALITLLFALCVSAQAQQPKKVPRVGFLTLLTHPDPREEEFVQGLRELGHIDGQNITIEYRRSAGEVEHLATLAKELVRLKVDLIVARSTPAIEAAKNVTKTIPMRDARSRRPGQKRLRRQLGAPRREHHGQFQYQSGTCRQET